MLMVHDWFRNQPKNSFSFFYVPLRSLKTAALIVSSMNILLKTTASEKPIAEINIEKNLCEKLFKVSSYPYKYPWTIEMIV